MVERASARRDAARSRRIQDGTFAKEFIADIKAGGPRMKELRAKAQGSQIEAVGKELRGMMPFVSGGKKPA